MYIPPAFRETNLARLHECMERYSFATLITHGGAEIESSHLPILVERDRGPHGRLVGHMARANPQWRCSDGQPALTVFHGPHAYISASWYVEPNVVPTWNYVAVHVYGTMHLVNERATLLEIVSRTVGVYEPESGPAWSIRDADPEFIERLLDAIVGFTIDIERIEGKWKLSQNHEPQRREKVIDALRAAGGHDGLAIAELMSATLE